MNLLVCGSKGFIGSRVLRSVKEKKRFSVYTYDRKLHEVKSAYADSLSLDEWAQKCVALNKPLTIVYLAGMPAARSGSRSEAVSELHEANVRLPMAIVRAFSSLSHLRVVYLSSVKVNGEKTAPGQPFQLEEKPKPIDPYGISKWEAEQGLQQIAQETGMEVVIIRPPLVYGPGVKGNFANLIKLVGKGLPLPLGAIHNQRSMIALDNLVDLIITCIEESNQDQQQ